MAKTIKCYLHGNKEYMYDKGMEAGLTREQLEKFQFGLYEVEIDIKADDEGNAKIIKVNGRELKENP